MFHSLVYGLVCVLFFAFPTESQAVSQRFTLKQAVEHALEANPSIEAKLYAIERASMAVREAQSAFLPTATLTANLSQLENSGGVGSTEDYSNQSNNIGIRLSLSLFAGFTHLNTVQKNMLSKDIEKANHNQARLELIGNIQLQFLQLLKAREDMKTVQDSKTRIETQLQAANAFVKVGMAPYLNVLQNEVEMTQVNQQEIRVLNSIRTAEVILNTYLGYNVDEKIDYVGDLKSFNGALEYDETEALNMALNNRPDLIIAQKSVDVAIEQAQITAGSYLPRVNMSFENSRAHKGYTDDAYLGSNYTRRYWSVGLNFSWDIFNGGSTTFRLLGERKALAGLRKEYENAMNNAKAGVIESLLTINAARELILVSRKGVEAATESYAMSNKRYNTHTGTITELLDAQLQLTQAEENYNSAVTEYHSARSRFFYNIGVENFDLQ